MPDLIPEPRHWRTARRLVALSSDRGVEAVVDALYVSDPEDLPLTVYALTRMIVAPEPTPAQHGRGRPRLDDREFTEEEARRAHAARQRGDDSTWAREGDRAYARIRKREARRARAAMDARVPR